MSKKQKKPTHVSGYLSDGTPIFSSVNIFSQETVELIEEERRQEDEERSRLEREELWKMEQEERGADKAQVELSLKIKTSASEETLAEAH